MHLFYLCPATGFRVVPPADVPASPGYDLVVDCSGHPPALEAAVAMTRPGATLVMFGCAPPGTEDPSLRELLRIPPREPIPGGGSLLGRVHFRRQLWIRHWLCLFRNSWRGTIPFCIIGLNYINEIMTKVVLSPSFLVIPR